MGPLSRGGNKQGLGRQTREPSMVAVGSGKDKGKVMCRNPDLTENSRGWKPSVDMAQRRLIFKVNLSLGFLRRNY